MRGSLVGIAVAAATRARAWLDGMRFNISRIVATRTGMFHRLLSRRLPSICPKEEYP